jgi:hypothetical protein
MTVTQGPETVRPLSRYDIDRRSTVRADLLASRMAAGASVLDFGAYRGAIAARLAELGFQVTAVSPEIEPSTGYVPIVGMLTPDQIRKLGRFDYTLALSVLHHQQDRWPQMWQALVDITEVALYVEVPRPDEPKVPHPDGLAEHFESFPTVGTFPGKRDGWSRDIVEVNC